jgi:hypothetical protein
MQKKMTSKTLIGLPFLILLFAVSCRFADKDRIEYSQTCKFIFHDKKSIEILGTDTLLFKNTISKINYEKDLKSVVLAFQTGERVVFEINQSKLTSIKIAYKNRIVSVPDSIVDKISNVQYNTVSLLWHGGYKRAFNAKYYYIRFNFGLVKSFGEYPYIELFFSQGFFKEANINEVLEEKEIQNNNF